MNIFKFAVNNKLLVNLFGIFIVVAGIVSALQLNRDAFPNFSLDIVSINTNYPGNATEIETLITRPIEKELKTVSGIDRVESVSGEGYSRIDLVLEGTSLNKQKVVTDIQQAVNRVKDLPTDLLNDPLVTEIRTQDTPIIEVALSGNVSRAVLQEEANALEKQLESIDNVASVVKKGWKESQVWIELELEKLRKNQISMHQVMQSLKLGLLNVPAGSIQDSGKEKLIRISTQALTLEELSNWVVRSNFGGRSIRIKDLGKVVSSFEDNDVKLKVDGVLSVSLVILKKEKGDTITLVEQVRSKVEDFTTQSKLKKIKATFVNDISYFVKRRLNILLQNGWMGLLLVICSLFLFLSRGVAIWTAIGLPVAMGCALWFMSLYGLTINLISMFGLIIILGMLVDDSIVVAESVYRHIEEGKDPKDAAILGASEVFKPVLITILTTIVFFLPLVFMSGVFGKFVKEIPIVVIITLLASLLECFLILPSHLAEFAAPIKQAQNEKNNSQSYFEKLKSAYGSLLESFLNHSRKLTFVALIAMVGGIYLGFTQIPINLFPGKDIEIFFIRMESEIGTPAEESIQFLNQIESLVMQLPKEELKNTVSELGSMGQDPNDPNRKVGGHLGQVTVYLHSQENRKRETLDIMNAVRSKVRGLNLPPKIWLDQVNPGPPQGKDIDIKITGPNLEVSNEISNKLRGMLLGIQGVKDIQDDSDAGKKEFLIRPNLNKLAKASVSPFVLSNTVRVATYGEKVGELKKGDEEIDIRVQSSSAFGEDFKNLKKLQIENAFGQLISLESLVDFEEIEKRSFVRHKDYRRVLNLTANVDETLVNSRNVNAELRQFFKNKLKEDYPLYDLQFGGQEKDTNESLADLKRAAILAAMMAFLILASAFNSIKQPLLILLAVPFGVCSALAALWLHGEPLSFLAFLGLVGLSGVTVNDSVIMIDRINTKRREGGALIKGVLEASQERLRPVILTSITTVLGLAPIAYGLGGSDPFLKPMAITISWGLAFGTLLTLFLVPAAYVALEKRELL